MKKVWCGQPFNIQNLSQKLFGLAWQEKCNDENDDKGFLVLVLILPLDYCCKGTGANEWIMEPFLLMLYTCVRKRGIVFLKRLMKAKDGLPDYLTDGKTEGGTVSCKFADDKKMNYLKL